MPQYIDRQIPTSVTNAKLFYAGQIPVDKSKSLIHSIQYFRFLCLYFQIRRAFQGHQISMPRIFILWSGCVLAPFPRAAGPAYLWSGFMNSSVRRWTGQFILYVGVIRKLGQGCQLLVFIVMGARPTPTACTPVLGCLKWPNENLWASSHSSNILFHRCAKLIRYFGTGSEQVVDSLYRTNEHGPECLKSLPSIGKME